MLKIKDNTTKQKLSVQDCQLWDDNLVKETLVQMKSIRNGTIYINDETVKLYNEKVKGMKSNASFVRYVRELKKNHYFDEESWGRINDK